MASLPRTGVLVAATSLACLFVTPVLAADLEIAGLRLGMTPDEAKAALRSFGVDPERIQERKSRFAYMDGTNRHETPEFLDGINADKVVLKGSVRVGDQFELTFSPPPDGGRLVLVVRETKNPVDAPTVGQYREAILEKYGPPDENQSGRLTWLSAPGTVNCAAFLAAHATIDERLNQIYLGSKGARLNQLRNPKKIGGPDDCALVMTYTVGTMDARPAKRVTATLVDTASWVKAQLAAMQWIDGLQGDAVKARDAGATKPKL